ncbi:MAG: DUF4255 domain-containing protein [Crocosphaera sp.]|nr:DUF4255 domain-containing protein [Crocosphaera sp.]
MSNFLAIATVTATLSKFLQGEVGLVVPGARVTTLRPDGTEGVIPDPQVNIYAYQVTPNGALRNADLATRRADGSLLQRPQAALDIYYLLSFYGNEARLEPQRMLGSIVQTLHARPLLTRRMIQETIEDPNFSFLSDSDLTEQIEKVRFTPIILNLEELSKLWSVFFQVRYTISVVYQASVVLIESDETPRKSLPVRDRNLYILPFRQPVIEQIQSSIMEEREGEFVPRQPLEFGANQPILPNSILKILGRQLQGRGQEIAMLSGGENQERLGEETLVRLGDTEVEPTQINAREIEVVLTDFSADALRGGLQGIQVVQPLMMGTPPIRHSGLESNVAAIVLRPTMKMNIEEDEVNITDQRDRNGITYYTGTITLKDFVPPIDEEQRVLLLLNEFQSTATATARGYQFKAPRRNGIPENDSQESTDEITFEFQDVAAGTYLVRVQVDGAESLLSFGTEPTQPDNPQYIQPRVTLP